MFVKYYQKRLLNFFVLGQFLIMYPVSISAAENSNGTVKENENLANSKGTENPGTARQTLEEDHDIENDPNENLGTDSKFITSFKLDGSVNYPLGLTIDYYLFNSPDSKHHIAIAAGLDTIQFKYFYPSAEVRYEWGTNHRIAGALKYGLLYVAEVYPVIDGMFSSGMMTGPIDGPENPNMYSVHGITFLAGYSHQGSNRLFFSIMGGLSLSFDHPGWDFENSKMILELVYPNLTFEIKLGFRFI